MSFFGGDKKRPTKPSDVAIAVAGLVAGGALCVVAWAAIQLVRATRSVQKPVVDFFEEELAQGRVYRDVKRSFLSDVGAATHINESEGRPIPHARPMPTPMPFGMGGGPPQARATPSPASAAKENGVAVGGKTYVPMGQTGGGQTGSGQAGDSAPDGVSEEQ